jgi:hypothetical protein
VILASSFERQLTQDPPPGFDQIELLSKLANRKFSDIIISGTPTDRRNGEQNLKKQASIGMP